MTVQTEASILSALEGVGSRPSLRPRLILGASQADLILQLHLRTSPPLKPEKVRFRMALWAWDSAGPAPSDPRPTESGSGNSTHAGFSLTQAFPGAPTTRPLQLPPHPPVR